MLVVRQLGTGTGARRRLGRGGSGRTNHVLTLDAPAAFDAPFNAASVRHVVAWRKGHHPSWLSGGREISINLPWPRDSKRGPVSPH